MNNKVFIEDIEVEFKHLGAPVLYVPDHVLDTEHPDCEVGFISIVRRGNIWVKFHENDSGTRCDTKNLKWL